MALKSVLMQQLTRCNHTLATFQMLVLRLLDKQVIYRARSQQERQLFDDFLVCQDVVEEYLGLMGVKLAVDLRGGFVIAYPPGSSAPGVEEDEESPFGTLIQRPLKLEEKGLLLSLRLLYEEALRGGELDEDGRAITDLESVFTRYLQIVKREMPTSTSQRKEVFRSMKRLSVIYDVGDLDDSESLVSITPIVEYLSLTSIAESIRQSLNPQDPVSEGEAPSSAVISEDDDVSVLLSDASDEAQVIADEDLPSDQDPPRVKPGLFDQFNAQSDTESVEEEAADYAPK